MTLFYAPPWRAFLYTNYLIIYVSVKLYRRKGPEGERERQRETGAERRHTRRRCAQCESLRWVVKCICSSLFFLLQFLSNFSYAYQLWLFNCVFSKERGERSRWGVGCGAAALITNANAKFMFAQNEIMLNAFLTLCSPQNWGQSEGRKRERGKKKKN